MLTSKLASVRKPVKLVILKYCFPQMKPTRFSLVDVLTLQASPCLRGDRGADKPPWRAPAPPRPWHPPPPPLSP